MSENDKEIAIINATGMIVSAIGHRYENAEILGLVQNVRRVLADETTVEMEPPKKEPAVSVRASVKPDTVTCLHCGKVMKSLKRHLGKEHGETPEAYRDFWKLPETHPIVAPNYSETRSRLAKDNGLGKKRAH